MLKLNHLTGFGSGAAAAGAAGDVTSYAFDGTGDYLSTPDHADWDLTDFTIEAFVYHTKTDAANEYYYSQWVSNHNYRRFGRLGSGSSSVISYKAKESSATIIEVLSSATPLSIDTWHHVAVVRENDDYFIFVDGVDVTSSGTPDISNPAALAAAVHIGESDTGGYMTGYIDEIRVSNTARYTSGFTPTTTQFTSDANTKLLIHCGETKTGTTGSGATFTDSGNTGHTVTENGNAIESTGNFYKF
jgi:hypothetical protein